MRNQNIYAGISKDILEKIGEGAERGNIKCKSKFSNTY